MIVKIGLFIRNILFFIIVVIRIGMFYKNYIKFKVFLFVIKKGEDYCKDIKLNYKVYKIKIKVIGNILISVIFFMVCLNV